MLLLLGLQAPCIAAEEKTLPEPDITVQAVASQPSPEEMQRQLQALQEKMAAMQQDYDAKLRELNATIQSFTVQISKTGVVPVQPTQPVPVDDQDIGEELIFGPDDAQAASAKPAGPLTPQTLGVPLFSGQNTGGGTYGGNAINRQVQTFNPDIAVTGDFVGNAANHKLAGRNRIGARELEFSFSAPIDPYASATFIFSKPEDETLEVEEGYIKVLQLPWDLQAKVGKMYSPFGKLNATHTHELPQTDRPNVLTNFFGDEGLKETGVALSKILPTPWFSSLDVQLGNGQTGPFFSRDALTRPTLISRWRNVFELSDTRFLEVGLSGALGSRTINFDTAVNPDQIYRSSGVQGLDITYRWIPPNQNHQFTWQTELLAAQMESPALGDRRLFGGYSFAEYKFNQRWSAGVRADYSDVPLLADAREYAIAPYVNFFQSEFGRVRMEYKHTVGKNTPSHDQLWLQYTVLIGTHPAHAF
jgi:hypothetical protein